MTRKEIIQYIRKYDHFFSDAHLETYPSHELMVIKISIDVEREKNKEFQSDCKRERKSMRKLSVFV